MLTCEEVTRLMSESLEQNPGFRQRIGIRLHLSLCELCKRFGEQLAFIRDMVTRYQKAVDDDTAMGEDVTLSREARETMKHMVSKK